MRLRPPLAAAFAGALIALSGCSPEAEPEARSDTRQALAAPAAAPPSVAGKMETKPRPASGEPQKRIAAAAEGRRRCGWLSNPTPANWWLTDRDGQWILSTQGADQAPGMDEMPDMSTAGWVETNGHYGYGCACMTISFDPATERVTRISGAEPKPIAQCRADRRLPKPE